MWQHRPHSTLVVFKSLTRRHLPWPLPALLAWALAWSVWLSTPASGLASVGSFALAMLSAGLFALGARSRWRLLITLAGFPLSLALSGLSRGLPAIAWLLPLALLALWVDGAESVQHQLQGIGWRELGAVAYLAVLSTLLGYGLWTRLLQRYAASTVAPLSLLVPVIGLVSAMVLLGERPSTVQWLGTLAVLLGMVINQLGGVWARRRR